MKFLNEKYIKESIWMLGVSIAVLKFGSFGFMGLLLLFLADLAYKIIVKSTSFYDYFKKKFKLLSFCCFYLLRALFASFIIFILNTLSTLDTCIYDTVLRFLLLFFPIYTFFSRSISEFFCFYKKEPDSVEVKNYLFLNYILILELSIFCLLCLFFFSGLLKLFFLKYPLVIQHFNKYRRIR